MRMRRGIAVHQVLRVIVAGGFDALPGCQIIPGDTGIIDDQRVISLRAKSGRSPVCAPGQDASGRSLGVAQDDELVVTEVSFLNNPIKNIDFRLEFDAYGTVFVVVTRGIILEGAVGEYQIAIRAERRPPFPG